MKECPSLFDLLLNFLFSLFIPISFVPPLFHTLTERDYIVEIQFKG